jgi:hypothetical protein
VGRLLPGSHAEATAQSSGVLIRRGVAQGCCDHVAGRAGAREGGGCHRTKQGYGLRFAAPPSISCVCACAAGLLHHGVAQGCCTMDCACICKWCWSNLVVSEMCSVDWCGVTLVRCCGWLCAQTYQHVQGAAEDACGCLSHAKTGVNAVWMALDDVEVGEGGEVDDAGV